MHRIGRTGRGGATGTAISIVGPQDRMQLSRIEKLLGTRLKFCEIPGLEPKLPALSKMGDQSRGGKGQGGRQPNIRFKKRSASFSNQGRRKQNAEHAA